jgi:hypothetical protein
MERALTLVKCDGMPDWFSIEWARHANRHWLEPDSEMPNVVHCRYSGRPSDADVEGTADEMAAIASAIETNASTSFHRCAARRVDDGYELSSPRNSQQPAHISFAQAAHLAGEIRRVLQAHASATKVDAVDPIGGSEGTPSTRV